MKSPIRERIAPSVPFTLKFDEPNGDSRTLSFRLAFDMNAYALVEQKCGLSMMTQLGKVFDEPSITVTTVLFWAALQIHHPEYEGELGLHAVRSLVSFPDLKDILNVCMDAFILQLPKTQQDDVKKLRASVAGLGDDAAAPLAPETEAAQP